MRRQRWPFKAFEHCRLSRLAFRMVISRNMAGLSLHLI